MEGPRPTANIWRRPTGPLVHLETKVYPSAGPDEPYYHERTRRRDPEYRLPYVGAGGPTGGPGRGPMAAGRVRVGDTPPYERGRGTTYLIHPNEAVGLAGDLSLPDLPLLLAEFAPRGFVPARGTSSAAGRDATAACAHDVTVRDRYPRFVARSFGLGLGDHDRPATRGLEERSCKAEVGSAGRSNRSPCGSGLSVAGPAAIRECEKPFGGAPGYAAERGRDTVFDRERVRDGAGN